MNKIHLIGFLVIIIALFAFVAFKSKRIPTIPNEIPTPTIPQTPTLLPQEGLPAVVEAKRQAIFAATLTKDYATLARVADPDLKYSFGGEIEGGFAEYMKLTDQREKQSTFSIIQTLLKLPYAVNANSIMGDIYTWPSVFTKESSRWTDEDVKMMRTFLTDEQIESYREFGGYVYYRVGINAKGEWIFYLAGD